MKNKKKDIQSFMNKWLPIIKELDRKDLEAVKSGKTPEPINTKILNQMINELYEGKDFDI